MDGAMNDSPRTLGWIDTRLAGVFNEAVMYRLQVWHVCWLCAVVLSMGCRPGRRIGFTHSWRDYAILDAMAIASLVGQLDVVNKHLFKIDESTLLDPRELEQLLRTNDLDPDFIASRWGGHPSARLVNQVGNPYQASVSKSAKGTVVIVWSVGNGDVVSYTNEMTW